jgi:putative NADH-flavin reductase
MKIIIFGASGLTGGELIAQGLARSLAVTGFVRRPGSLQAHPGLYIVVGDVFNADQVAAAIAGHDAVFATLGARSLGQSDLLERSMANILAGMERHGVRRLIVLGAGGALGAKRALRDQGALSRAFSGLLVDTLLKNPMASQRAQYALIEASPADYTIVQPPRLTNRPATGSYRVQEAAFPPQMKATPRADVADFMLRQLKDQIWVRKSPFLCV